MMLQLITIRTLTPSSSNIPTYFYLFALVCVLCIIPSQCVSISDTKISTSRIPLRTEVCAYSNYTFTEEQHLSSLSSLSTSSSYKYLEESEIKQMLTTHTFTQLHSLTYLTLSPHILAISIMLTLIPFLICCCTRPDKYPTCLILRKPSEELYTRRELKVPSFVLLLLYLMIIGASAAAALSEYSIQLVQYGNNVGCRYMAIGDDLLNGRVSTSDNSRFWIGLGPLKNELETFSGKYATFYSQSNNSLNTSANVKVQENNIYASIEGEFTTYANVVYTNAFRQSDGLTYHPVTSSFKELIYGPTTNKTSLLGNIKSKESALMTEIDLALDPMIDAWTRLEAIGQSSLQALITETSTNINTISKLTNNTMYTHTEYSNSAHNSTLTIALTFIYGCILALSLLGGICSLVLCCWMVVRVRVVLYITCGGLVVLFFVGMCLLVYLQIMMGNIEQVCRYVDTKMSTKEGIQEIMDEIGYKGSLFRECIIENGYKADGNGDIMAQIDSNFSQSFTDINLLSKYTQNFNKLVPNFDLSNFTYPFTESTSTLEKIKQSLLLEITDTIGLQHITALANKAYTKLSTCTSPNNINTDSWIPSLSIINCQTGSYLQSACTDLSDLSVCPQGCYQMYEQLNSASGDSTNYEPHLDVRYGSGCNYVEYVVDLHENWELPKISDTNTVSSRLSVIQTDVNTYYSSVNTIKSKLNSFKSVIEQNYNELNLTTGSFVGTNCHTIGESILELRDSLCIGYLESIKYNIVVLCIICYCVLLVSCVSVCAGVRHYLHLRKMEVEVGYKGVPITISSNRIVDKSDFE